MTTPIPLMVELCAGTAALSLRLHRDGAKPPVSRMGSKSGYASALLRILGLIPGQRADRYLWCEPDPGVRLLLHAYRDATLARAAAAIIRGWAAEDPRALWERLRAEGPPRLPEGQVDAGEVARAVITGQWAYRRMEPASGWCSVRVPRADEPIMDGDRKPARNIAADVDTLGTLPEATITPDARTIDPREVARWACWMVWTLPASKPGGGSFCGPGHVSKAGKVPFPSGTTYPRHVAARFASVPSSLPAALLPDAREVDPREVARWAQITASNRLIHTAWSDTEGRWINTGDGGATFGGAAFCSPPERTAEAFDAAPGDVPALIHPDAREVDPREVARWATIQAGSLGGMHGQGPTAFEAYGHNPKTGQRYPGNPANSITAPALHALDTIDGALIHPDARDIDPPALPPGTVAYMDPSYVGTTGYADNLGRAEVVILARRWAAAGAVVAISEAEPIPELVAEGWHAVEITGERIGQARTFSKQKREWVTLNRPPAWVPPVQGSLF